MYINADPSKMFIPFDFVMIFLEIYPKDNKVCSEIYLCFSHTCNFFSLLFKLWNILIDECKKYICTVKRITMMQTLEYPPLRLR